MHLSFQVCPANSPLMTFLGIQKSKILSTQHREKDSIEHIEKLLWVFVNNEAADEAVEARKPTALSPAQAELLSSDEN